MHLTPEPAQGLGDGLIPVLGGVLIKAAPLRSAATAPPAPSSGVMPRAQARQLGAASQLFRGGSSRLPDSPALPGTRRERSASPPAMAFGHSRLNPAESRRVERLSG